MRFGTLGAIRRRVQRSAPGHVSHCALALFSLLRRDARGRTYAASGARRSRAGRCGVQ